MGGARISDRDDWFDVWFCDKQDILSIMYKNMESDLRAGYDPHGKSIMDERWEIARYTEIFHKQMDKFYLMSDAEVNRWCFYDLKKRGTIE